MTEERYPRPPIAWLTVIVLFLLYILSLVDRYVIALLMEPIKADLGISDFELSLLQGLAFAVFYAICAIPVGLALDRFDRRKVLFGCILIWSLGAAGCGLATGFATLAIGRALIGAGESGFTTGAYSIVGDSFPPERVSFAMSIFVMGGVMGAGIVFLLGGPLVGAVLDGAISHWPLLAGFAPWQQAFLITGIPGLLMAFLVFLFPEPKRRRAASAVAPNGGYGEALAFILANRRAFSAIILGTGLVYTVTIAMQLWSPAFFMRVHGWSPAQIGVAMGLAQMLPALSLPFHGWMADRFFAKGRTDAHLVWCLITMIAAAPFAFFAYLVSDPWVTVVLFGIYMTLILSTSSLGPAAAQVVTPPELRGRVSAIFVLVTGLVGMVVGNSAVGFATDYIFGDPQKVGVSLAALVVVVFSIVAVLFMQGRAGMRAMIATPAGSDA